MAKPRIDVVNALTNIPIIGEIIQYRIPSVGDPGDSGLVGRNFTPDFDVNVYRKVRNSYEKIGDASQKYFDSHKSVSFALKLNDGVPAGKDKIVGIKCGEFEEVYSDPTFETK